MELVNRTVVPVAKGGLPTDKLTAQFDYDFDLSQGEPNLRAITQAETKALQSALNAAFDADIGVEYHLQLNWLLLQIPTSVMKRLQDQGLTDHVAQLDHIEELVNGVVSAWLVK